MVFLTTALVNEPLDEEPDIFAPCARCVRRAGRGR